MTSVTRPGQPFYPSPAGVKQEGTDPSQHSVPCPAPPRFNQRAQTEGSPSSPTPCRGTGWDGRGPRESEGSRVSPRHPQRRRQGSRGEKRDGRGEAMRRPERKGRRGKGGSLSGFAPLPAALTHRSWRRPRPRGRRAATRAHARTCRPRPPLQRFPCSRPGGVARLRAGVGRP